MRCQVLGDSVLVNSLFVLAQAGALDFGALIDLGNDSAAINITIGELVQPGAEWKPHWRERVAGGGGLWGGGKKTLPLEADRLCLLCALCLSATSPVLASGVLFCVRLRDFARAEPSPVPVIDFEPDRESIKLHSKLVMHVPWTPNNHLHAFLDLVLNFEVCTTPYNEQWSFLFVGPGEEQTPTHSLARSLTPSLLHSFTPSLLHSFTHTLSFMWRQPRSTALRCSR